MWAAQQTLHLIYSNPAVSHHTIPLAARQTTCLVTCTVTVHKHILGCHMQHLTKGKQCVRDLSRKFFTVCSKYSFQVFLLCSLTAFSSSLMAALFCRSTEICWKRDDRVLAGSLERTLNWPCNSSRSTRMKKREVM